MALWCVQELLCTLMLTLWADAAESAINACSWHQFGEKELKKNCAADDESVLTWKTFWASGTLFFSCRAELLKARPAKSGTFWKIRQTQTVGKKSRDLSGFLSQYLDWTVGIFCLDHLISRLCGLFSVCLEPFWLHNLLMTELKPAALKWFLHQNVKCN